MRMISRVNPPNTELHQIMYTIHKIHTKLQLVDTSKKLCDLIVLFLVNRSIKLFGLFVPYTGQKALLNVLMCFSEGNSAV